jgi:polyketide synthase 12
VSADELAPARRTPLTVPWPLSGRSRFALRDQAARLYGFLAAHLALDPADVGFSLAA